MLYVHTCFRLWNTDLESLDRVEGSKVMAVLSTPTA